MFILSGRRSSAWACRAIAAGIKSVLALPLLAMISTAAWAATPAEERLDKFVPIHIETAQFFYSSMLGVPAIAVIARKDEPSVHMRAAELPDHGAQITSIRNALAAGIYEGSALALGSTACPRGEPLLMETFWVVYHDGLVVGFRQQESDLEVRHMDVDWMKKSVPKVDAKLVASSADTFDLDQVRRGGKALAMAINQPCISEADLLSSIGPDAARVVHRRVPPLPPSPPTRDLVPLPPPSLDEPMPRLQPTPDAAYNAQHPPIFPEGAARAGHFGTALVRAKVGVDGNVMETKVEQSSGFPELDESAAAAVAGWKFKPPIKDGAPQISWVRYPINFGPPKVPAQP